MTTTIRSFLNQLSLLVVYTLLTACAVVQDRYAEHTTTPEARRAFHAEIFDSARSQVEEKYFDPGFNGRDWQAIGEKYREAAISSTDREALYRVLNSMFAEIGVSHLQAFPPARMRQVRSRSYQGFGFQFLLYDGQVVVKDVYAGSPAEQAGVKPGWLFVSLDGIAVPQAFSELSINPDQSYLHEFVDENDAIIQVALSVQAVDQQVRLSRRINNDIAYIRFDQFSYRDMKWLRNELKEALSVPALILDLRSNSGGYEFALKKAIREFFQGEVASGQVVTSGGRQKDMVADTFFAAGYAGDVYILTSGATSSSAEIFAHVLKSHGRATLVGSKTAGKVLGSRYFRLPDSGYLQIPLRSYIGIAGENLEGTGVLPDQEVPVASLAQLRLGEDAALEKVLSLASGK